MDKNTISIIYMMRVRRERRDSIDIYVWPTDSREIMEQSDENKHALSKR